MKQQTQKDLMATFMILGAEAFKNGKSSAPCQDKDTMDLIAQQKWQIGQGLPYLEVWTKAWHTAHKISTDEELKKMGFFQEEQKKEISIFSKKGQKKLDSYFKEC